MTLRDTPRLAPRVLFLILAAYFALHVAARTLVSDSLQLDEAEQILLTQEWKLGYGSQPPLYTWLQKILFAGCGQTVFALALLKNCLLLGVFACLFLAAREAFTDAPTAALAAASLTMFPGLMWESQRDQSHLVLATLLGAALLAAFLRLARTRTAAAYALFGLTAGLGVLAKYNFLLVLAALVAAAASLAPWRDVLRDRRLVFAALACAATLGAHLAWAGTHTELTMSQSYKFKIPAGAPVNAFITGGLDFLKALVEYAGPPLAIFGILCWRHGSVQPRSAPAPAAIALVRRTILIGLALAAVTVLAFKVTSVKARWLQPLLVLMPIMLLDWARARLTPPATRALLALGGTMLVVMPTLLYGSAWAARWTRRPTNLNLPYGAWAAQVRADGFERGLIIGRDLSVAGNLQHNFRDSVAVAPELVPQRRSITGPTLVAWKPAGVNAAMTNAFEFCQQLTGVRPQVEAVRSAEAPLLFHSGQSAALGYVIIPRPAK